MSEVEKMYENAGVKYYKEICAIKNVIDKVGNKECYFEVCCTSCPLNKTSFTSEKQLELIKWFVTNNAELETLEITYYLNDCFQISSCTKSSHFETNFDDALAGLINNLWQDLTDAERKQIKNILESEVRE